MNKSHLPKKLPIDIDMGVFSEELAAASFELGKLDGLQRNLLNPSLLVSPLTVKEATVSSKIEGTRSTVVDVMIYEASRTGGKGDTLEVVNYRLAIIEASRRISSQKLNNNFIKGIHSLLLKGVRGHNVRGEFRKEQVFIGAKGQNIENATYIPPQPYLVPEYMENLEKYILSYKLNSLVKAAIIHYQFEAIHPFGDGNGRVGRLIVPLFLYSEGLLCQPILYLSGFFEKNRSKYIETLHEVDIKGAYEDWVKFFLEAVLVQSKETQLLINDINELHTKTLKVMSGFKSPYSDGAVNFLFKKPIFKSSDLVRELGSERRTGFRIIKKLQERKIVHKSETKVHKGNLYFFNDLLKLL